MTFRHEQEEHDSTDPGITDQVRDFYEGYPYPRPIDSLEKYHCNNIS